MNRTRAGLVSMFVAASILLVGCADGERPPPAPSPLVGVPTAPTYPSVKAVAAKLARSPVGCVDAHPVGTNGVEVDCLGKPDGYTSRMLSIYWYGHDRYSRDGSVDAWREEGATVAVGADWLVLADEQRLPAIARTLVGVIIGSVPSRPRGTIPPIPSSPQVKDLAALAAAVDKAIGCPDPDIDTADGWFACDPEAGGWQCVTGGLFRDANSRDTNVADWVYTPLPAVVVTAGNWYVYASPQGGCAKVNLNPVRAHLGGILLDNGVRLPD